MAAVTTLAAQVFDTLQLAALALPVADRVLDELQGAGLAEVVDGEDRLEDGLQPDLTLAVRGRRIHLQKPLVGAFLHLDQVRGGNGRLDLREVRPHTGTISWIGHVGGDPLRTTLSFERRTPAGVRLVPADRSAQHEAT